MDIFLGMLLGILFMTCLLGTTAILLLTLHEIGWLRKSKPVNDKEQLKRQRATIKGQLEEKYYPVTAGYPLTEFRFIGDPIDYIFFNGYTDAKDGDGDIEEIVFIEVKYNTSRLSPHQNKIKKAIEAKKVRWETIIIKEDTDDR